MVVHGLANREGGAAHRSRAIASVLGVTYLHLILLDAQLRLQPIKQDRHVQ